MLSLIGLKILTWEMSIWKKKYKAENLKSTGIFGSLVILTSTRQKIFQWNKHDSKACKIQTHDNFIVGQESQEYKEREASTNR